MNKESITTTNVQMGYILASGKEYSNGTTTNASCCSFAKIRGYKKGHDTYMRIKVYSKYMPAGYDTFEFLQKWIDFINTFGLEIQLTKKSDHEFITYVQRRNDEKSYIFLFTLNLIRYAWSAHYNHLPAIILDLREREDLKKLDNWEIFQLAHVISGKKHFDDMSPIRNKDSNPFYITSEEFLKKRLKIALGGHLATFNINIKSNSAEILKKVKTLRKAKKNFLEIYNLLSTKVNNIPEYSKAICIDTSNFDKELTKGNKYEIIKVLKNTIRIKNNNRIQKIYNKKRFNLI